MQYLRRLLPLTLVFALTVAASGQADSVMASDPAAGTSQSPGATEGPELAKTKVAAQRATSQEEQKPGDLLPAGADPQNTLGWSLMKHAASDQKTFWTSGKDLGREGTKPFAGFIGFASLLIASDSWLAKQVPDSPQQLKRSRDISNYAVYSLIGAGGGAFVLGHIRNNDHLSETGLLSGEAALNSTLVSYLFKSVTQRPRPGTGAKSGMFFQAGNSFPSEHSAVAWSVASVLAHEYPGLLTKFLAYGLAAGVTMSRVTSRQHFASDAFVGSALGWYFGRQVYRAHHDPELGGGPWGNLIEREEPSESSHREENMGSSPVPLDSWVYPAFERLIALGYIKNAYAGQRPWTRLQCAHFLEEAGEVLAQDTATDAGANDVVRLYQALANEFARETERSNGERNAILALDSVYGRTTAISGPPLRDSYHFGQTIIDDDGRPYAQGFNSYSGVTAHGEAGFFSFDFRGEYQHAPSAPSYSLSALQAVATEDGTSVLPNGTSTIDRFRLLTGSISVTWKNTQFSFGKQEVWLGPGQSGALLMSDNAEPIPMVRMTTVAPVHIPLLSNIFGPAQTEFFLGQLAGHHWELDFPNLLGPNLSPQPFIHGEKISFKPTPNLEFGMGVTAMFAGPGLPFTWANFLRTYYVHSQNAKTNPGKRASAADLSYRVPGLRQWLTVYLDSMVVDEFSPIGSTRATVNPGVYLPRLPKIPKLELRAEGLHEPLTREFGPGFVYSDSRRFRDGYTNHGLLLGNWVGRAGRGCQGWLTYSFSPQSKLQLTYRHQEVAKGYIGGGRSIDYSIAGQARLSPGLALSGSVQYERWRFPILASRSQSNITASVQLTFYPSWRNQK